MRHALKTEKTYLADGFRLGPSIGAGLAVLGVGGVPLLYGPQGCAVTGSALLARHFRRAMPLHSVAMNEISLIRGDHVALQESLRDIAATHPNAPIGIITSAVSQARGDDPAIISQMAAQTCTNTIVPISVSDFCGTFETGWGDAARCLIESVQPPRRDSRIAAGSIALLTGSHLTAGDIDELRDILFAFGLQGVFVPDITVAMAQKRKGRLADLPCCADVAAIGASMRLAAKALQAQTGANFTAFDSLSGLEAADRFVAWLMRISGRPMPDVLQRQRNTLIGVLDQARKRLCRRRMAIAADPDTLAEQLGWLREVGIDLQIAVCSGVPPDAHECDGIPLRGGDLADLAEAAIGADILAGPAPIRDYAAPFGVPVIDCGIPIVDRIDAAFRVGIGYRGTVNRILELVECLQRHPKKHIKILLYD
jgi:nitrogenase molybdenum-iron protein NifN